MTAVVDLDNDGNDDLIWGERAIDIATGQEQYCADRDSYRGHSDAVIPVFDDVSGEWFVYTNREGDPTAQPRVCLYDALGHRVWGQVDQGHMDMGWVARWDNGQRVAMSIRIGHKTCGPDGRFHTGMTEFAFDAFSGEAVALPFSVYQTLPVDLNGDGMHELVRGIPGGDGAVLDRQGNVVGNVGGSVAIAAKLLPLLGEQLLVYCQDGMIRIFADRNADDNEEAACRYENRAYATNLRLMSTGWNQTALCGI